MNYLLILPPVTFFIVLLFGIIVSKLTSTIAFKATSKPAGQCKPYACGEDLQNPRVQPDYSQFFPFAFFFTIMHVMALIITTVPIAAIRYSGNAFLYVIGAVCGLLILFRR